MLSSVFEMASKRSYDLGFKLKVIEKAEHIGNRPASRHFRVDERRIREWRKKKNTLKLESEGKRSKRRLSGGGRKIKHEDEDRKLAEWIIQERSYRRRVRRRDIMEKGKELFRDEDFKCSRGWLEKFMKRWDFSLRRRTTTAQQLPRAVCDKVSSFVNYCRDQLLLNGYSRSDIANMDETAIWADMPGETTVTTKGVRSVPMFSTGHEKSRVTVCLAAFADG